MGSWFNVKKDKDVDRLYIMEVEVDGNVVYKVGKSSGHSSKQRMLQICGSHFDVYRFSPRISIVRDRECNDVFKKETKCHRELEEFRFSSEKAFSGSCELFNVDKEKVIEVYERILEDKEDCGE